MKMCVVLWVGVVRVVEGNLVAWEDTAKSEAMRGLR